METSEAETKTQTEKLPKNCKENRYYYRHREEILEKKRLARLAKNGIDVSNPEEIKATLEEKRKKKEEDERIKKERENKRKMKEAEILQKKVDRENKRKMKEALILNSPGVKQSLEY
jgi:translation initiation factor 4G